MKPIDDFDIKSFWVEVYTKVLEFHGVTHDFTMKIGSSMWDESSNEMIRG